MKIVLYGNSNFPEGMAEAQKLGLIGRALFEGNNQVYIINRVGSHSESTKLKYIGRSENIIYIYSSKHIWYNNNIILRKFYKCKGILAEIKLFDKIMPDALILSSKKVIDILFYKLLTTIYKKKLLLVFHENPRAVLKNQLLNKINILLYELLAFKLVDAVFPISDKLLSIVRQYNSKLPSYKLPVLVDISKFEVNYDRPDKNKYFIFTGAAGYYEIINIVIEAFELIINKDVMLYLVLNGSISEINHVRLKCELLSKKGQIKIYSYLNYEELISLLNNSLAGLIPLTNTVRDLSRFPHKVGEYLASKRPIIITKYGEPAEYLMDKVSAFIAEDCKPDLIAFKMQEIIDNPDLATKVGLNGYEVCLNSFNYKSYSSTLSEFVNKI